MPVDPLNQVQDLDLMIQVAEPSNSQVERFLRAQIESGRLPEGQRLPPIGELASRWHVSRGTVQKAMKYLVADGLVTASRKRGTCVSAGARKVQIGVLADSSLMDESSHFHRAVYRGLCKRVTEMEPRWRCNLYDGLSLGKHPGLLLAAESKVLGAVVALDGDQIERLKLQTLSELPCVRFHPSWQPEPESGDKVDVQYDVALDFYRFGLDSFRYFAHQGYRNVVYLRTLDHSPDSELDLHGIETAIAEYGAPRPAIHQLESRRHLRGNELEEWGYQVIAMLAQSWRRKSAWPDAVTISDDIVARGLTTAILQYVPAKHYPAVLVLANEGICHFYGLPVLRYEFPLGDLSNALISILKARMTRGPLLDLPLRVPGVLQTASRKPSRANEAKGSLAVPPSC